MVLSEIGDGIAGVNGGSVNEDVVDRTGLDYLLYISKRVQQSSSERWQDGQLNVLPDSMMNEGFADVVQCFTPEEDHGSLV